MGWYGQGVRGADKFPWNDEHVAVLRRLWAEGLSATQIARTLAAAEGRGLTRNAVIGKVHRIGLVGRATPSRPVRARPSRPPSPVRVERGPAAKPLPPMPPPAPDALTALNWCGVAHTILSVQDDVCRYPYGDAQREGVFFCGRATSDAQFGVYCQEHARVCYQPGSSHQAQRLARRHLVEGVQRARLGAFEP